MDEDGIHLEQKITELWNKLEQQEQQIVSLQGERNRTIRELRKARLEVAVPTDAIRKIARTMGPLDDVVFTKIGEDSLAVEEIISTIMGVEVKVKTAIPQYTISNIGSRGVRLDNYAEIIVEAELLENCEWGKREPW